MSLRKKWEGIVVKQNKLPEASTLSINPILSHPIDAYIPRQYM